MTENKKVRPVMATRKSMMSVSRFRQTIRDNHEFQLLLEDYPKHPEFYIRTFMLQINGKRRKIVTYQRNEFGDALREIHHMLAYAVRGSYTSHENSFAYKEKTGILSVLEKHLSSTVFLKTDIHAYFDSIELEKMLECLFRKRPTLEKQRKFWGKALAVCFYEGRLPIGFVSSPILSDLYLNDMDAKFSAKRGIRYTRYADDIIFSANIKNAEDKFRKIQEELKDYLAPLHLELNKKKTYIRVLKQEGDAIHLLGLNLVRTAKGNNRITVSDSYIRNTSKEFCELLQEKDQLEDQELRERFSQVCGKIGFIRHASAQSTEKLRKMIRIKTGTDTDLGQESLTELLLSGKTHLLCDIWEPKEEQTLKKWLRLDIPDAGHVWEKTNIPENGEIRSISALRYYLNNFCLDIESGNWDLRIIKISLTIGEDTAEIMTREDIPAFRDHVFRLRKTKEKIDYSAEYHYRRNSGKNGKPEQYHQPAFLHTRIPGIGAIWDEEKNKWGLIYPFRESINILDDKKEQERLENETISAFSEWQGYLSLEMRWPQNAGKEQHEKIRKICSGIARISGINIVEEDYDKRYFHCTGEERLSPDALRELVHQLAELNKARWEAAGRLKMNGQYATVCVPEDGKPWSHCSIRLTGRPTMDMIIESSKIEI